MVEDCRPLFECLDPHEDVYFTDDPIPLRYVFRFDSSIVYIGSCFQFTPNDRTAWNNMVEHRIKPDPKFCLGAGWARKTQYLPDEYWQDKEEQSQQRRS